MPVQSQTAFAPSSYRPRFTGGHKQTLYTWARRRTFPALPAPEARFFDVASDARVLAHCHWQPERQSRPTVLLLHGLEASSEAHYVRGLADKAWRLGCNVVRLNQRNCGGTEHLSRGLYHSGLTADPRVVLTELRETDGLSVFGVAGYSLGGNLAMKLAGELGAAELPEVRAFCAVSPVLELEACVTAIERPANRIYEWNFCRSLQARMRRKARIHPGLYDVAGLWKIWSIRAFDERYTAPHHGFDGASDYYHRASGMRVIDRVARPSLILSAADDPFVPSAIFDAAPLRANPHITTIVTPCGGHCGFVEAPNGDDGYYAERLTIAFLAEHLGLKPGRSGTGTSAAPGGPVLG